MREQCQTFLLSQLPEEAHADAQLAAGHGSSSTDAHDNMLIERAGAPFLPRIPLAICQLQ